MGVNSHPAFDEKPGIKFVWPYAHQISMSGPMAPIQNNAYDRCLLIPHPTSLEQYPHLPSSSSLGCGALSSSSLYIAFAMMFLIEFEDILQEQEKSN